MARGESPPFARGQTFDGTDVSKTTATDDFEHLEGQEYTFPDLDPRDSSYAYRSGQYVKCRVVRNNAATTLLPKRLAKMEATAGEVGGVVAGYERLAPIGFGNSGQLPAFPVDEYLPTGGASQYHLLYVVTEGPSLCITGSAGGLLTSVSVGDRLVAATAANSTEDTAGRVVIQNVTAGDTDITADEIANSVQNCVGFAMSARTTDETESDILVLVSNW